MGANRVGLRKAPALSTPGLKLSGAKAVSWGYKKVHYFAGGFPAWKEAGYPVEVSKDLQR